jgi:transposase-like protein
MEHPQPYQVMPGLAPAAYEALKADIAARRVQVAVEYDEEGHILDGIHRVQICQELGIPERPRVVRSGLTEAQKREHAWRLNLTRRRLSRTQQRAIVLALRQEGWTQEHIAQALGLGQPTVSRWLQEFIQMDKLPQPDTIQGKDGKRYPSTKAGPRAQPQPEGVSQSGSGRAQLTLFHTPEAANPEVSLSQHADTRYELVTLASHPEVRHAGLARPAEQEAAEGPGSAPADHKGMQAEVTKGPEFAQEPSPPQAAEDALQMGSTGLLKAFTELRHAIEAQGGVQSLSARWSPETKARYVTEIRHVKAILTTWEAVLIGEVSETAGVHNGADGQVATLHPSPTVADEAHGDGGADLISTSPPDHDPFPDLEEITL